MRILALLPVLAVAACVDSAMAPQVSGGSSDADHIVNEKTEVFSMPMIACNNEVVDLSGTLHTKIDFAFGPDGSIKSSTSFDYKLSGIGSVTGVKYEAKQSFSEKADVKDDHSVTSTAVRFHMVGKGKVPDTDMGFTQKTVIVNGEVKQSREDTWSKCK